MRREPTPLRVTPTSGRRLLACAALVLATGSLVACGSESPTPAGSGGVVGHLSGTSDVEGQRGDPALDGGGLAVLPIAAMDGPFWELVDTEPIADPRAWSSIVGELTEAEVAELGGTVAPIDDEGDFRIQAPPGEHAVCYWSGSVGGRLTGCDTVDLPREGEIEASWGEAGFHAELAG